MSTDMLPTAYADDPNFRYGAQAEVVADSISPDGHRLTSWDVVFHRFVLAEANTHRVMSRNSASSRAIPAEKQLLRVVREPAWPVSWPAEQRGMQGGSELQGDDLADAQEVVASLHAAATRIIGEYLDQHPDKSTRLHKSVLSRYLEPFMWHRVVFTATDIDGFYAQRAHPDAQPEIRVAAEAMRVAQNESTPQPLDYGEWHLPLVSDQPRDGEEQSDHDLAAELVTDGHERTEGLNVVGVLKRVSTARCARTSFMTHTGIRDLADDLRLFFDTLASANPPHASPLEHVATPVNPAETDLRDVPGNLTGYRQFRHDIFPDW